MRDELTQISFCPFEAQNASELLIAALVSNANAIPGSRSPFAAPISMESVKRITPLHPQKSRDSVFIKAVLIRDWSIRNRNISSPSKLRSCVGKLG
ncbi:hypothetical protein CEXT_458391 [Caerostris extrusa]|uniref:Uncharacterized protein n=1 Tax=Caerostris extrusa TaxID=172846 RepID=A0AAV4R2B2_CAEEX|nr:hypothetical protein CEXT_458391 [Caerostris extrusa]